MKWWRHRGTREDKISIWYDFFTADSNNIRSAFELTMDGDQLERSHFFCLRSHLIFFISNEGFFLESFGHTFEGSIRLNSSRLYAFQKMKIHVFKVDNVELFYSGWSDCLIIGVLIKFFFFPFGVLTEDLLTIDSIVVLRLFKNVVFLQMYLIC